MGKEPMGLDAALAVVDGMEETAIEESGSSQHDVTREMRAEQATALHVVAGHARDAGPLRANLEDVRARLRSAEEMHLDCVRMLSLAVWKMGGTFEVRREDIEQLGVLTEIARESGYGFSDNTLTLRVRAFTPSGNPLPAPGPLTRAMSLRPTDADVPSAPIGERYADLYVGPEPENEPTDAEVLEGLRVSRALVAEHQMNEPDVRMLARRQAEALERVLSRAPRPAEEVLVRVREDDAARRIEAHAAALIEGQVRALRGDVHTYGASMEIGDTRSDFRIFLSAIAQAVAAEVVPGARAVAVGHTEQVREALHKVLRPSEVPPVAVVAAWGREGREAVLAWARREDACGSTRGGVKAPEPLLGWLTSRVRVEKGGA